MSDASVQQEISLESLVAQVVDEFRERQKRGEKPDIEEYAARHPQAAELLRKVLASWRLIGMAEVGGALDSGAVSGEPATYVLGDFRLLREVGRGGMGVVYEAEQLSLGRRVALKVLPLASTMDSRQLQRFQNEARAAAGLHHTNIVPVYFVGSERGVHYYAMQFIEGLDLASVIAQLREQTGRKVHDSRHVPTVDAAEGQVIAPIALPSAETRALAGLSTERSKQAEHFRTVARLGIQAAEALDHAHQMGIVHRDVKPANLLVDDAGRLWVTDFGLAQMQSDTRLTMTGDLVGTLRYMSPEQALAKRIVVDHRTDIYSLGATLYELLTLEPAFDGKDRQELLRQIAFEEPRRPRRLNRAIPQELETIILKASERNPAERYATAQELADDLRNFVEDRPIRAKRPSLLNRLGRWRRRHKALIWGVAAVVLTVLLLGGAALWKQLQEEQRQQAISEGQRNALEQALGEDLREADLLQQQERWSEEMQVLERASGRLATGGPPHLREGVEQRRTNVAMVARLEEARLQRSVLVPAGFDYAGADQAYTVAFASYGLNLKTLDPAEAANRIRTLPIRTQLVAALDDWAFIMKLQRVGSEEAVRVVARLADDDPWRQQLRDPAVSKDRAVLEHLAEAEGVLAQPPGNLTLLSEALDVMKGKAAAVRLLRSAQQQHPADFWINFKLACLLSSRPATKMEASAFFRVALALRPHTPIVYHNLGIALRDQKKLGESEGAFRKAIELQPDFVEAYSNLGAILFEQKKLPEADAACRKAIELKPNYARSYNNLGITLTEQKKLRESEAAFRKAIELKPDYAEIYNNLGVNLHDQKKVVEAEAAYSKAIELDTGFAQPYINLAVIFIDQKKWQEAEAACRKAIELDADYAEAYNNLGVVLRDQKKWPEAEIACRKAIELNADYAEAYNNLGGALYGQKKLGEAETAFRKALKLEPNYFQAYNNLGILLRDQRKWLEAEAAFRKAIELNADYAEAYYDLGLILMDQKKWQEAEVAFRKALKLEPNYFQAYNNLGVILMGQKRWPEAETAFRKAIELKPDFAETYSNLGVVLRDQKKPLDAEAALRKAVELKPDYAEAYYDLGNVLVDQKKWPEAEAACCKAIKLKPDFLEAYFNLGVILMRQKKLQEAEAAYRKVIELKPDYAEPYCGLGQALKEQGRFADALAAFKRGHELGSKSPRWPYPSALWVRQAERLVELDAKLPQFLKGETKPVNAAECLEIAFMCQQYKSHYFAAVRFFQEAFTAQPRLADDLRAGHRYNAACAAALAGCGQGKDAHTLDDKERARLRKQALDWLRADLTAWRNVLEKNKDKAAPVVGQQMQHWLEDPDFNGVRGAEALAKLPEAECGDWQQVWKDVEALRQRAATEMKEGRKDPQPPDEKKPPTPKP